jgi:hypothetical protein
MDPGPWFNLYHKEVSIRITQALDFCHEGSERQQIKDLLRNLIHRVDAVREGKTIRGMIYYYSPAHAFTVCPHGNAIPEWGRTLVLLLSFFALCDA